ncbi:MAG TPA: nucleotide sugar dehydrogenase, partial [Chloroflexia bacterium]|nr:nucleotide sugar dehydrogenase [Chloroflexia bacterium]
MGYVGLPAAVTFAESGFPVTGFDVIKAKVDRLNSGDSYIEDVTSTRLQGVVDSGRFHATSNFSNLSDQDVIVIAVPTPLNKTRDPDLTAVKGATQSIAENLRPGQLIILESTTYPGTTEEVVKPILEQSGLRAGEDFFLAFSPERIDPSSKNWHFANVPKVVGGYTPDCLAVAQTFYSQVVEKVIPVSSTQVAEMCKIFENVFRVVNVALVNEMTLLCDRMNLNFWEVLDAASTKPYGFMKFTPGPGVGGHCIPIDPFYLTWKAREHDFNTRFIELAGEINLQMPHYVRELVIRALNSQGKSLNNASILLLGVAYKKDVGDVRESPAVKIVELLHHSKASLSYHDPFVPVFEEGHLTMNSVELTADTLASADCVVIVTDHSSFDIEFVVNHARMIVDTRNVTAGIAEQREKILVL